MTTLDTVDVKDQSNGTSEESANSDEVVVDANIYAFLLEVIDRHEDDIDEQQRNLKDLAGAMYRPTFTRRLFRALFPSVEATRRVR